VSQPLELWLWTITDPLTGKRRQTTYRMTEAQARERFGDDAVRTHASGKITTEFANALGRAW
jgi:hypothetical protein